MPNLVTGLRVNRVSFVDRAAVRDPQKPSEPRRLLLWKREGNEPASAPEKGASQMPNEDELRAAVEKAEKERDDMKTALAKAEEERDQALAKAAEKPETEPTASGEELNKAELPEPVRAALEKAEKEAVDLRKAAEEATEIAKAEREARVTREFIAKAEEYRALPVEAPKFGPVLKSASEKLSKEEYEALETVLKAADEQIAKGELFKEQGRSGLPDAPESGMGLAMRKAEELRKADSTLTQEQAFRRVMETDPEVQRAYAAETR